MCIGMWWSVVMLILVIICVCLFSCRLKGWVLIGLVGWLYWGVFWMLWWNWLCVNLIILLFLFCCGWVLMLKIGNVGCVGVWFVFGFFGWFVFWLLRILNFMVVCLLVYSSFGIVGSVGCYWWRIWWVMLLESFMYNVIFCWMLSFVLIFWWIICRRCIGLVLVSWIGWCCRFGNVC